MDIYVRKMKENPFFLHWIHPVSTLNKKIAWCNDTGWYIVRWSKYSTKTTLWEGSWTQNNIYSLCILQKSQN